MSVLFLYLRVIILVYGTFGVSYVGVPIFGMLTSMVLFKWDGSDDFAPQLDQAVSSELECGCKDKNW